MKAVDRPKRIQLRRIKGWRLPTNAVKVDRSTKYGNPFRVGDDYGAGALSQSDAAELFRIDELCRPIWEAAKKDLRGKDLACWCKLNAPCHADVLLEIANE